MPASTPAQFVGAVDLSSDSVWLFRHEEFAARAQQKPEGRLHLYFYIAPELSAGAGCHINDFESFRLANRFAEVFGTEEAGTSDA